MTTAAMLTILLFALLGVVLTRGTTTGRGARRGRREIETLWPLPDPTAVRADPLMIVESTQVTPVPSGFRWDGTPKPPKPVTFDPEGLYVHTVDAVGGVTKHPITDPNLQEAVRRIAAAQQKRQEPPARPPLPAPAQAVDMATVWDRLGHPDLAAASRALDDALTRPDIHGYCPWHQARTEGGTVIPLPILGCPRCAGALPGGGR